MAGLRGIYLPSPAFRRAMRRRARGPSDRRTDPGTSAIPTAPALVDLAGAAMAVGVAAGFLELAVATFQIHGLHRVGLATLKISRHAAWMIPVAEAAITLLLTLAMVGPATAWSALRDRRQGRSGPSKRSWRWAGTVLGTLLLLGPLLSVRRLHAAAALVLAFGGGTRLGRLLVRPTPAWRRGARRAGIVALGGLLAYSFWEWDRVAHAEERAWSRPASGRRTCSGSSWTPSAPTT